MFETPGLDHLIVLQFNYGIKPRRHTLLKLCHTPAPQAYTNDQRLTNDSSSGYNNVDHDDFKHLSELHSSCRYLECLASPSKMSASMELSSAKKNLADVLGDSMKQYVIN